MKHMGVLNACMRRREVILKCDVDDRTKRKLELLDAQERYEFVTERCFSNLVSLIIKFNLCEDGIWCLESMKVPTVGRGTASE